MVQKPVHLLVTSLLLGFCPSLLLARTLTFEQRVGAQAAIEQVYYSHQLGASQPFEQAVSRSLLEHKVTTYLQQSAALERFWHRPITADMLQRELERMVRRTRAPDRLEELFAALGHDTFLMQECLARPALAERLLDSYVAFDERIQAVPRETARALHQALSRGRRDAAPVGVSRSIIELVEVKPGDVSHREEETPAGEPDADGVSRIELAPDAFLDWRKKLPDQIGAAGPLRDEREAFVAELLLESGPGRLRVIRYQVPKRGRSEWMVEVGKELDPASVTAVARDTVPIPTPGSPSAQSCACGSADFWDNASLDDMPEPRMYSSALWTGNSMIVWGGRVSFDTNTGGRYDPATDTWTSTSTLNAPAPRINALLFWTGDKVLVWGGFTTAPFSEPIPINSGGLYDPLSDSWSSISTSGAPALQRLSGYAAVWTGSELILWGGYDTFLGTFPNTGYRYNLAGNSWAGTSTSGAPPGRTNPAAIWTGSQMIIWGGGDLTTNFTDGYKYDPSGDTWLPISTSSAPSPRRDAFAIWTGSSMLVMAGCNGTNSILHLCGGGTIQSDGGIYDPAHDSWSAISTADAPVPRESRSMVWTGSKMILWGGYTNSVYFNDGARYDIGTDTWTPTSTLGAPTGRYTQVAAWSGNEMIVWGGYDGGVTNTGGRYDPVNDSWVPTSTGPGPSPRYGHVAHWTGNSMLVWGGTGVGPAGSGYLLLNSGGRYDPALDSWSSLSTAGAPSLRSSYYSVWTGNQMIVWGGFDGVARLASGARYDPVADSWAPTSLVGAPSARSSHRMVWSGNRMLVWGGFDGVNYLNTGGRYDPSSDTWTELSQSGAPAGVSSFTALWTGNRMFVWGGKNSTAPGGSTSGGLYDPLHDTWRPTSFVNVPAPRLGESAVWTGSEAILWGGGQYQNSGGRYDPASDTWHPTSLANVPQARNGHSAVWTGTRMLMWGGYNASFESADPFLKTGGIYDPVSDSWIATSASGTPFARANHSAVWTGEKMLVWGGTVQGYSNDGGAYCGIFPPHYYEDVDTDGYGNTSSTITSCSQPAGYSLTPGDCSDGDASIWTAPSEVLSLQFTDPTTLEWSAPAQPGATTVLYDAIRSGNPADFMSGASCLATDTASLSASDATVPALGTTLNYLVRAQDGCPSGVGSLGTASSGIARTGLNCP